jgi:integrase
MLPLVKLALETAMRRNELLGLRWERIDLQKSTIFLKLTKNGTNRAVPLKCVLKQTRER